MERPTFMSYQTRKTIYMDGAQMHKCAAIASHVLTKKEFKQKLAGVTADTDAPPRVVIPRKIFQKRLFSGVYTS